MVQGGMRGGGCGECGVRQRRGGRVPRGWGRWLGPGRGWEAAGRPWPGALAESWCWGLPAGVSEREVEPEGPVLPGGGTVELEMETMAGS